MATTRLTILSLSVAAVLAIGGLSASAAPAKLFLPAAAERLPAGTNLAESGFFGTVAVAWGRNYPAAQLGAGYADNYEVSPVPVLDLTEIRSMVSSGYASYALLGDGTAVAWGSATRGDGSTEKSILRVPVVEKTEGSETRTMTGVTAIAAAFGHALALVTDAEHEGEVMTWGASEFGERGNGEYKYGEYKNSLEGGRVEPRSDAIAGPGLEHVVVIAAGGMADYALQDEGDKTTLWAWGGNLHGRLGTGQEGDAVVCKGEGQETPCSPTPQEVDLGAIGLPPGVTVTSISAGKTAAYALLSDGRVLAWGENVQGELGNGTTENSDVPQYVCAVGAKLPCSEHEEYLEEVKSVAGGETFALALLDNGEVVGWGGNQAGQLGGESSEGCASGFYTCQLTAKPIEGLGGVTAISAGAWYSLALVNDTEHEGEVYSFGGCSWKATTKASIIANAKYRQILEHWSIQAGAITTPKAARRSRPGRPAPSEPESGRRGHHGRSTRVDGSDDLLDVDPLQVDARGAEVGVPELALDDAQRHSLAGELDGVSMAQWCGANRRLTPASDAWRRNSARTAAADQGRPRVGPSITQNSGPVSLVCARLRRSRAASLGGLASSVDIASMADRDHTDESLLLEQFVDDSVGPAASRPPTLVLQGQTLAETLRVLCDRIKSLEHSRRHGDRQSIELAARWRHDDEPPRRVGHLRRVRRRSRPARSSLSSTPASPAAMAFSLARTWAVSDRSDMIASVSSRLSRSSALTNTAAGRPLRVTTTRSCWRATRLTISEKRAFTVASGNVSDMTRIITRAQAHHKTARALASPRRSSSAGLLPPATEARPFQQSRSRSGGCACFRVHAAVCTAS